MSDSDIQKCLKYSQTKSFIGTEKDTFELKLQIRLLKMTKYYSSEPFMDDTSWAVMKLHNFIL